MARIATRNGGLRETASLITDGNPRTLYVGRMPRRDAESVGTKIDHIVSRKITGSQPDHSVAEWIADLPDQLHAKLLKFDLVAPRIAPDPEPEPDPVLTLKVFLDQYITDHPGKAGTIEQLEITARSLCHKFGDDRPIDSITSGDAEGFRKWLETKGNERKGYKCGLARNTVRRRIGRSKQFFRYAVKRKLITDNPFADEISATGGNEERLAMIPSEWIETIIRQKTNCEDWKVMLAFARYAGMRSHETRIQRWEDIDIPNRKMLVRSHKTPPVRVCPIFPELIPHLMRAREMAEPGAEFVQNRYRHDDNIQTELKRMVERAKLVPWSKLMQNLRATRETELAARYPLKDVTSWLGNSPTVAGKHYLMTQEESFARAIEEGAAITGITVGVDRRNPHQNPHHTLHDRASQENTRVSSNAENTGFDASGVLAALSDILQGYPVRTRSVPQNTGKADHADQSTPQSTPDRERFIDELGSVITDGLSPSELEQLVGQFNVWGDREITTTVTDADRSDHSDHRHSRAATVVSADIRSERGTLATGDYSIRGLERHVAIERKELSDLVACCGRERDRFEREVQRLLSYPTRAIIVEGSWEDIEAANWRSKLTTKQVGSSITSWITQGIPIVLAGNHDRAGTIVASMLRQAAKHRYQEARAFAANIIEANQA